MVLFLVLHKSGMTDKMIKRNTRLPEKGPKKNGMGGVTCDRYARIYIYFIYDSVNNILMY